MIVTSSFISLISTLASPFFLKTEEADETLH